MSNQDDFEYEEVDSDDEIFRVDSGGLGNLSQMDGSFRSANA